MIEDAFVCSINHPDGVKLNVLYRNSIDPITRTTKEHHLFAYRVIPPDTHFKVHMELIKPTEKELESIQTLIACYQGGNNLALGHGSSIGLGGFKMASPKIEVITPALLKNWLESDEPSPNRMSLSWPESLNSEDHRFKQVSVHLYPQTPIAVHDADRPWKKGDPQIMFKRMPDNRLKVPGSSIKGVVRGHCRKILLTMAGSRFEKQADALIEQLFGSTKQQSALFFSDAVADQPYEPFAQTFNAVDRFTGGVADKYLYQVESAMPEKLTMSCYLNSAWLAKNEWSTGLLLFLMRDALEGDLTVGWGKNKGFGLIRAMVMHPVTEVALAEAEGVNADTVPEWERIWSNLVTHYGQDKLKQSIDNLLNQLKKKTA